MKEVPIKYEGTSLYKTITWIKKRWKRKARMGKILQKCIFSPLKGKDTNEYSLHIQSHLKKKKLESKDVINLCYLR